MEKYELFGGIYAIVPCHNEGFSISETIIEICRFIPASRIIVVDNASEDNTAEIARKFGVHVIYEHNKGKGFAVRKAFQLVPKNAIAVLMVDGDHTYSLENLPQAVALMKRKNLDMVIGERVALDNSGAYRSGHMFGNLLISKIVSLTFNLQKIDSLSGFRLMSIPFIKSFTGGASGFEIEMELNAHLHTLKSPYSQVKVIYRNRKIGSYSKLRTYRDGIRILKRCFFLFQSERPSLAYKLLAMPWLLICLYLGQIPVRDYLELREIPHFPSLIVSTCAFIFASLLWVAGIILDKVRVLRVSETRRTYLEYCQTI